LAGTIALGCSGTADEPSGDSGAGSAGSSGVPAAGGSSPGANAGGSAGTSGSGSLGGASGSGGSTGGSTSGASGAGGSNAGAAGSEASGGSGGRAGTGGSGGTGGLPNTGGPIGFASQNGGTTGGKDGEVVTASTFAELKSYAESSEAYVILVEGTISNGADGGQIRVKSNKSIIGVGGSAFLNGIGIDISNNDNVILQNLRVSLTGVTTRTDKAGVFGDGKVLVNGGDAISISGTSKNVWIDHCEVFSEDPATQTNKDLYDGLIDIKGQTGFITLSWNYLHDHHKGGLVGAADDDLYDDRKVTLHHNYYDNVKLRVPMYRGSTGHFFNNYVVGATDATEIRANTCVRVEKNYYEELHYSIYTPSDSPGKTERIDNIEVKRTERAYPANCTASIPYSYAEVLLDAADVKTAVPAGAGVGKI
jgi:pectate lyase